MYFIWSGSHANTDRIYYLPGNQETSPNLVCHLGVTFQWLLNNLHQVHLFYRVTISADLLVGTPDVTNCY